MAILHGIGLTWGLPSSDGWDNDGVAPRDFLVSLVETVTPGRYATYPPVHLAILGLVTSPVTGVALGRAASLSAHDVVAETIKVPYMTAIAVIARLVALGMSLGIVVFLARLAEELRALALGLGVADRDSKGRFADPRVARAGWLTAAFVGVNATGTYYAHTSNLDLPYLFWAAWGSLLFVRAIAKGTPRLLRRAFALFVLAVGTKDQAYALFVLSVPIVLVGWLVFEPRAGGEQEPGERGGRRAKALKEVTLAALGAIALYLAVSGALFNPRGFAARVAFLTGPASQDYVQYTRDWSGRMRVLADGISRFDQCYPSVAVLAILGGLGLALVRVVRAARRGRDAKVDAPSPVVTALGHAYPLLVALSFTITFNWVALRTDHRFVLPQSIFLAVYGGLALDALLAIPSRRILVLAGQGLVSVVLARSLFECAIVDANLLGDPRYAAEAWLRAHVKPGDTIEAYGRNVYLPRLPSEARIIRVGPEPPDRRSPMPGIEEIEQPFGKASERGARFVVVSDGWVWRYLLDPRREQGGGLAVPKVHAQTMGDEEGRDYFIRLHEQRAGFVLAYEARFESAFFPPREIHSSTGRAIRIYERR